MLPPEIAKQIQKIEIKTRRLVDEITGGAYHSVFKGRGIEFDEVREYTPEDDVRDIDWNVSARMGSPYIKKYIEERELTVLLLVDVSASGAFGSAEKTKRRTAAELAALLARVHGVHSLADMGLDDSFYHKMAFLSPYVRQRLTFMRTLKFYDFYDEVATP